MTPPSSHVLVYSWHCLAKYRRDSVFWLLPCFLIQLTWSYQVLPHQCVLTPPSSPVLLYSWHGLVKYCRISVFWLLPPPLFFYTADIILPSTEASVCSDASLFLCFCIQLTLSCQVPPRQCFLTPSPSPLFWYSWHGLAKYCRISVYWLLPPPMFLCTADTVMRSTASSMLSDSSPVLVYSWHCLARYYRISVFWLLPDPLFLYTAGIVLRSTVASVCSYASLLQCSCVKLIISCEVLPHQCILTPPSYPVPVYSWHCLAKYCRINVFWRLPLPRLVYSWHCFATSVFSDSSPVLVYSWHCLDKYFRIGVYRLLPHPLFLYTSVIVLLSTAASVCSVSSLLPCSCIQLTLSCQVLPHQCVMTLSCFPVLVYNRRGLAKSRRISVFWLLPAPCSCI